MRPLHWSTRELLEHIRGLPQTASPPINWGFVNAWEAAGYPDIEPAPELARLAELEERLDKVANKLVEVTCKAADLSDRVAALEPKPAPPPEPARFVPTEPGWYWLEDGSDNKQQHVVKVFQAGRRLLWSGVSWSNVPVETHTVTWLAPVAPYAPPTRTEPPSEQVRAQMLARARGCFDYSGGYRGDPKLLEAFHHGIQTVINALSDPDGSFQSRTLEAIGAEPPTRTEEEARREPRRGDRWDGQTYTYTVLEPQGFGFRLLFGDGLTDSASRGSVGESWETYLGNFAHELEEP